MSQRLKAVLQHPTREGLLDGLRYSPDGRRLIAGDYPGGVIQVWDAETTRQLTRIETGFGYRGSARWFHVTPDWTAVYVSREKRKITPFERDGKRLKRWEFDGDVRSWDLSNGKLLSVLQHDPPRNILCMELSPDGSKIVTGEQLPGEYEGSAPGQRACGTCRPGEAARCLTGSASTASSRRTARRLP